MKKVYETPEIEYDDFSLYEVVCANLYGGSKSRSAEFYAIGNTTGGASDESGLPDAGDNGDDIIRPRR